MERKMRRVIHFLGFFNPIVWLIIFWEIGHVILTGRFSL